MVRCLATQPGIGDGHPEFRSCWSKAWGDRAASIQSFTLLKSGDGLQRQGWSWQTSAPRFRTSRKHLPVVVLKATALQATDRQDYASAVDMARKALVEC